MTLPFSKKRPLSWSAISSFHYNREEWFNRYILNQKQQENASMYAGKAIGNKIESDPTYLPEVPRLPVFEKKMLGVLDKVPLIGYLDSYCPDTHAFNEYKTSKNKDRWTHKTAHDHGQLDMYTFLIWLNTKTKPEDIKINLVYIPVEETDDFSIVVSKEPIVILPVKKTMVDIIKFASHIKHTYKAMGEYVIHRRETGT